MFWFYQVKTALPFGGASFFAFAISRCKRSFEQNTVITFYPHSLLTIYKLLNSFSQRMWDGERPDTYIVPVNGLRVVTMHKTLFEPISSCP